MYTKKKSFGEIVRELFTDAEKKAERKRKKKK